MHSGYKAEGEKSGLDMNTTQRKSESHGHTLRFRYGFKKYTVTCNAPMSTIKRLQTDFSFKAICKKKNSGGQKELVIRREKMPRAAVTPHFPCCLLEDNELLDIQFIGISENKSSQVKNDTVPPNTPNLTDHSHENLVCFYIKTSGDKNIHWLMKNNELKKAVDYVCVYAVKGETVKMALKHDGRFKGLIFRKGALYDQETETITNLTNLVDYLDGKQFQVIVSQHQPGSQGSSQDMDQESKETVKEEKSKVPTTPQEEKPKQDSTNTQEKKTETPLKERKSRKYPDMKPIPNTQEILKLLQDQHGDLLKILKERGKVEVKKFFREEYDKSIQSFSEVKKVKQLMELSDFVCQIRIDGSAIGTGFLLFDRFVLTNAHVVGDLVPCTPTLKHKLTAAFYFEDMTSVGIVIEVKENVLAFFQGKDDMGNYLDFALLELNIDIKHPGLLSVYSASPSRGGVCIIGHPGGAVKQMDPCFIIAKEDIYQEAERYFEKNPKLHVLHVITQQVLAEDKERRESQIMYNSCFFHGSSGSPVFDNHCNLIGVHTGGYTYKGERKKTRSVMEYALPMLPILVHIFIQCSNNERYDVVQHFELQNNLKLVPQKVKEQLQKSINQQSMDVS